MKGIGQSRKFTSSSLTATYRTQPAAVSQKAADLTEIVPFSSQSAANGGKSYTELLHTRQEAEQGGGAGGRCDDVCEAWAGPGACTQ